MGRRAVYMYGESLPKSPAGQINCGLGMTLSSGTPGLSAPTVVITANSTVTIDGVEVRFQLTPNTEAPAEMNMYFPQYRALCMAENAVHTMHNIQTLRGALVRDALAWSKYVDQTIVLFGQEAEVVFASHHWPTWGQAELNTFLAKQRDLYAYLHNETLRQMNDGRTGMEIAEDFVLPTALQQTWSCRGYYGSVSHNVKAIYHRYMGWFDGNPAHLWEHPPVEAAKRYVDSVGGMEQMIALGQQYSDAGDLRFAATLLGHAVFADQDNRRAREALGAVYTQLGYAAENGTWRGFYLTGARELENASQPSQIAGDIATLLAMSLEQLFDSVAVRIDGPRAWDERFTIDWMVREMGVPTETHGWHLNLSNGALTGHRMAYVAPGTGGTSATLTVWLRHVQLAELIVGERKALEGLETRGDVGVWDRLQALITTADGSFAIVTPEKLVAGGSQQ
ncbi:beta-lactamase-like protein [Aspergillus ambiguus]|uniref:alkyl/aryl-sulfatase n=1 Tax=Aspergillus ambiguus TaxID=176160 RepID=UPI003CCDE792